MTVNPSTFKLVAGILGIGFLALIVAIAVLAGLHDDIPTILENLATGSLTALAALLVSPHSTDDPVPVSVTDQPVAVTDSPARKSIARRRRGDHGVSAVGVILAVVVVVIAFSLFGALHSPLFLLLLILALILVAVR